MNKKVKYIIFIISLLIFISGCKNNAASPSTIYGIGKYRGTWFADNFDIMDLSSNQWIQSEAGMTIKINSDTDMVINNIVPTSIKHLHDTIDSYNVYISTDNVPPQFSVIGKVLEAYYRLEFTSDDTAAATMLVKFQQGGISLILAIQKAELKK